MNLGPEIYPKSDVNSKIGDDWLNIIPSQEFSSSPLKVIRSVTVPSAIKWPFKSKLEPGVNSQITPALTVKVSPS